MSKQKGNPIPDWKKTYIRVNHETMTAQAMAKDLEISDSKVYNYCREIGIQTKPDEWYKVNRKPGTVIKGHPYVKPYLPEEPKKERPPAVYSNSRPYDQV